jgi:ATP-dependent RNA helicase RhlE
VTGPATDPVSKPFAPPASDGASAAVGFAALGLSPTLLRAAAQLGYRWPTPVQAAAIPVALQAQDLVATAPTGSGKTAAYGLALMQRLERMQRPAWRRTHALVLVPTRELAAQVAQTLRALCLGFRDSLKVAVLFGGVSVNPQMLGLRGGADVIVATPGRLLDLFGRNAVKLEDVEILVLDEADRLLEEGFAKELGQLKALLPAQRQTLFFSATFPAAVQALADAWLHAPTRLALAAEAAEAAEVEAAAVSSEDASAMAQAAWPHAGRITQRVIEVDATRRTALLRQLLKQDRWPRVLVFVATRYACEHVADKLRRAGVAATAFHGELSQGARTAALADFKAGSVQVLLATDMAARGLHIENLGVVLNYDLARSPTTHLHRIGRTARAGASGLALSFVNPSTEAHFRLIEKRQGQRLPRERIAGFEPLQAADALEPAAPASALDPQGVGGVKGKRKSKKDKLREAAQRHTNTGSGSSRMPKRP